MAWTDSVSVEKLRTLVGNPDNCYDTELSSYISAIISDIEYLTGLNFDFSGISESETFKNTKRKNEFALNGSILQIGAWQSVSLVERSSIGTSPSWNTLTADSDFTFEYHKTSPYSTITELYFLCSKIKNHEQIRITGIKGFSPEIPPELQLLIAQMVDAYYKDLDSDSLGKTVTNEKSLTRSVTYSKNDLQSLKIFTPTRIDDFYTIIRKYSVIKDYPF